MEWLNDRDGLFWDGGDCHVTIVRAIAYLMRLPHGSRLASSIDILPHSAYRVEREN